MTRTVLETLRRLIRINSVNPSYEQGQPEAAMASYLAEFWREHEIETWKQEVFPERPNIIARIEGEQPDKRVVFEAHTDTVSAVDMENPFDPVLRDGRLYGRGACDTKGGLAAMMHAMSQVKASGRKPPCEIWLAATVDEEHSCGGINALCRTLRADAAIVAEPTRLRVATACKGCLRWRIEIHGREAHSSKPEQGTNAIVQMAEVVRVMDRDTRALASRRHPTLGSPTFNIGIIRGGTQVNIVPDHCAIEIDRRLLPGEEAGDVLRHYTTLLDDLRSAIPELSYTMEPPTILAPPVETPADIPLVQGAVEVLREMGLDPDPIGVPFTCDASALSAHGVPCVIFGPGSIDQAHTPEEFVECAQVEQAVDFYQRMMMTDLTAGR